MNPAGAENPPVQVKRHVGTLDTITSAYAQPGDPVGHEGFRQGASRGGDLESAVGPVRVAVPLARAQSTRHVSRRPW